MKISLSPVILRPETVTTSGTMMPLRILVPLFLTGCAAPPKPASPPPPSLDEKALVWNDVSTRLRILDPRPALGTPIRIALDLVNSGEETIIYDSAGVASYDSFDILGPDGRRVSHIARVGQTISHKSPLSPGQTVTLIKELDVSGTYLIRDSGTYHIRFDGHFFTMININEVDFLVRGQRENPADEPVVRSDWVKVDIGAGRPPPSVEIA